MANPFNAIGNHWLRHNNPRTLCPPGMPQAGKGPKRPLIMVPTLMRSGTHILIDLILNNFPAYQGKPLYVDLDLVLRHPQREEMLAKMREVGGFVVKTHCPQLIVKEGDVEVIQEIAAESIIISTKRDTDVVLESMVRFPELSRRFGDEATIVAGIERFYEFWQSREPTVFPFEQLLKNSEVPNIVAEIASVIDCPLPSKVVTPPEKAAYLRVCAVKAMTRVLGHRSPVINTTIQFARK